VLAFHFVYLMSSSLYTQHCSSKSLKTLFHTDDAGKGQAMSVFFTILKGPYDTILPWPFLCPVKITLVDQQGASAGSRNGSQPPRDIVRTFTPNPRPENEPFLGRPLQERNMSLGKYSIKCRPWRRLGTSWFYKFFLCKTLPTNCWWCRDKHVIA